MAVLEADTNGSSGKSHFLIYVPALLPSALNKEDVRLLLTSHVLSPSSGNKSKGNITDGSKSKKKTKESEATSGAISVLEDVFLVNVPLLLHHLETCIENDASLAAKYLIDVALPTVKTSLKASEAYISEQPDSFSKKEAAEAVINTSKRIVSMMRLLPEHLIVQETTAAVSVDNTGNPSSEATLSRHFRSKSDRFALNAATKAARSIMPRLMHHFDEWQAESAARSSDSSFAVDMSSVESLIAPFIDRERLLAALSAWCLDLTDHSSCESLESSDLHAEDSLFHSEDASEYLLIPDTPLRAIKEALIQLIGSTRKVNKLASGSHAHNWLSSLYLNQATIALNHAAESLLGGENASLSREVDQALRVEAFGAMWTELQLIAKGLGALEGR
jgi:hypothetical protein